MNILAVGSHWDDIELGCALSLTRLIKNGANVWGVVLADSYYVMPDGHERTESVALASGLKAFEAIGIKYIETEKLPNKKMVYSQPTMQRLEEICIQHNIEMVFTHWFGDHNTDHKTAWDISKVAFRNVPNLLMYQSNTYFDNVSVFMPHYLFGFSKEEYEFKIQLAQMNEQEWQYRKDRWEREIFARERYWGYLCKHDYAEAFMICRMVNKL